MAWDFLLTFLIYIWLGNNLLSVNGSGFQIIIPEPNQFRILQFLTMTHPINTWLGIAHQLPWLIFDLATNHFLSLEWLSGLILEPNKLGYYCLVQWRMLSRPCLGLPTKFRDLYLLYSITYILSDTYTWTRPSIILLILIPEPNHLELITYCHNVLL